MKEIRIIIGGLGLGGTERHLGQVLPHLVKKGWHVTVLTLSANNPLAHKLEKAGVSIKPLKHYKFPKVFKRPLKILQSLHHLWRDFYKKPQSITHFFLPEAYGLGMAAAFLARNKAPKIMSRRSLNRYQKKYPGFKWLEEKLHQRMSLILANSQAVFKELHLEEGVPLEKLKLLYNGIDLNLYDKKKERQVTRERLGIEEDTLVFIIVANLIPYKGHVDLLKALSLIKEKLPDKWRLLCVGRNDGIGKYLSLQAESLGIADHIIWLGSRTDTIDLMLASDIGVLCSHEEGFSNAILEGMAAGLPMVVTDVGGNAEAVLDGKTGFVVPPHDARALGAALLKLSNNPTLVRQLGEAGRRRVSENFSLSACVEGYHGLYETLLKEQKI